MFITFEGGEGTGKTTLIKRLEKNLKNKGYDIVITREPGGQGSKLAEEIRSLVLSPQYSNVNAHTEALLYAASRAQHIDEVIKPSLEKNKIVICDRYIDSSLAYQAYARDLGYDFIMNINEYVKNYLPNLTFYIDLDPQIGIKRIQGREKNDRLDQEKIEFHKKVRDGYLKLVERFPNRIIKIDGTKTINEIELEIMNILSEKL